MNADLLQALISRSIINVGYIFVALLVIKSMENFVSKKYSKGNCKVVIDEKLHKINIATGLAAIIYPYVIYVIIILIGTFSTGLNDVWIANNLAWSHSVIPFIFAVIFVPLIGIGKWNWQTTIQIFLLSIITHFILDIFLFQLPLYFLYPIYTYDVLEYGFNLILSIDIYLSTYIGEIIVSILFAALYILPDRLRK